MKLPSFPILFLGFVVPLLAQVPTAPKSKFFIGPGVTTLDQPRVPFAQQPLTAPGTHSQSSASAVPPPSTGTTVVQTAQQPTSPAAIRSASPSHAPFGYAWMTTPPRPNLIQQATHSLGPEASDGPGPLRFSAGYVSRRLGASFHVEPPDAGLLAGHLLSGGLGDVGLYNGGDSATVYEDGLVSGDFTNNNGSGTAYPIGGGGASAYTLGGPYPQDGDHITFHSHSFSNNSQHFASAIDFSEADAGLGYYLRLGQSLGERAGFTLGWSATFTGIDSHFGTQPRLASRVRDYRTDYRYGYDFVDAYNSNTGDWIYGLVYDDAVANASYQAITGQPGHYAPPSQSSSTHLVNDWRGITQTTLDAHLKELFLSGEASWQPPQLPSLHLGLAAGPTLNVLTTNLRSSAGWINSSTGQQVPDTTLHERATTVKLGLGAEARARYDLTPDGRCYLEASAGYKWLQDTRLGGAFASAELDASSWELGLGMGIQLGDWPAGSPWSMTAGVAKRTLGVRVGPPSLSVIAPFTSGRGGRGDVGFYRVGSGRLDYDDGSIHAYKTDHWTYDSLNIIGAVFVSETGIINSPKQVRNTGRLDIFTPIEEVSFHSSGYTQSLLSVSTQDLHSESQGIGPYLDFHRNLWSAGAWSLGTTLEWSIVGDRAEATSAVNAIAQVHQQGQLFTYTYDLHSRVPSGSDYPLQLNGIVLLTADYEGPLDGDDYYTPFLNPRKSSSPIDRIVTYIARTSTTLDATLHSLAFSADLGWKPLPRLEFSLSGGPTLNVLHSDLTAVTEWTEVTGAFNTRGQQGRARNGPTTTSTLVARDIQQASSTAVKIGAGLLAHLRYDLTPDGRWYAEARGGYQWLSPVDVGKGNLHATLDASSWDIGGGFGCRLGQGGPCIEAIRQVGRVNLSTTSQPSPKPPGFFGRIREMWIARNLALAAEKKQR